MIVCVLSLLLAGAAFIGWEWFSIRKTLVRTVSTQARMIAENNKAAVAFGDVEDATGVLRSLVAESSIVFGCVYTNDGEALASYYRQDVSAEEVRPSQLRGRGHSFDEGYLTVWEPVLDDSGQTGMVCLRSDLDPLYRALKYDTLIIVVSLLLVSAAAFLMSSGLQRIISGPILGLARVARVVSDKKEYSVRATKYGNDEVGALIDAFNEMLGQIQQRDAALVDSNVDLERRVEERTAELRQEVVVRRKAEEALAETVRKLTRSNQELREFTRISAHDLKSPLRAIGTLADWICEDYTKKADEEGRQNARLLAGRAKRMSSFMDAIMFYSEVTSVDHKKEMVALSGLVEQVIDTMKVPDNVEIRVENKLPVVSGDPKFMSLIFQNLLANALKYIDKPEGLVRVGCVERGDFWQFYVSDNGCGIEEKYFDKIFEIFQMLSFRDETEDVGIGLSVTKKIVETYNGKIWVESAVGQGSTFFFTLPKTRIPAPRRAGVPSEAGSAV